MRISCLFVAGFYFLLAPLAPILALGLAPFGFSSLPVSIPFILQGSHLLVEENHLCRSLSINSNGVDNARMKVSFFESFSFFSIMGQTSRSEEYLFSIAKLRSLCAKTLDL